MGGVREPTWGTSHWGPSLHIALSFARSHCTCMGAGRKGEGGGGIPAWIPFAWYILHAKGEGCCAACMPALILLPPFTYLFRSMPEWGHHLLYTQFWGGRGQKGRHGTVSHCSPPLRLLIANRSRGGEHIPSPTQCYAHMREWDARGGCAARWHFCALLKCWRGPHLCINGGKIKGKQWRVLCSLGAILHPLLAYRGMCGGGGHPERAQCGNGKGQQVCPPPLGLPVSQLHLPDLHAGKLGG